MGGLGVVPVDEFAGDDPADGHTSEARGGMIARFEGGCIRSTRRILWG